MTSMFSVTLYTIFKFIQKIRTNDIHHLDEKIEEMHDRVISILKRTESKLDEHLRDHAVGSFSRHREDNL